MSTDARVKLSDVQRVELSIRKALESGDRCEAQAARAASCFACFCTEGCVSSFSSSCTVSAALADRDPVVVEAIIMLHDRGVDVLGEERAAAALRSRVPEAIRR